MSYNVCLVMLATLKIAIGYGLTLIILGIILLTWKD